LLIASHRYCTERLKKFPLLIFSNEARQSKPVAHPNPLAPKNNSRNNNRTPPVEVPIMAKYTDRLIFSG
jgi:hypothetical protein